MYEMKKAATLTDIIALKAAVDTILISARRREMMVPTKIE